MYSGGCFYYKKGSEIVWSDKNIPADARKPYAKMIRYGLHSYHSPHSYIASMLVYRGAYNTVKKSFITWKFSISISDILNWTDNCVVTVDNWYLCSSNLTHWGNETLTDNLSQIWGKYFRESTFIWQIW